MNRSPANGTGPRAALFIAMAVAFGAPVWSADIRVAGTDLLGIEFSRALHAFAGRNGFSVALAFDGSRPGLERLKTGRADCALLVLPAGELAALREFEAKPVGYQPVIVLAPAACPIERITFAQLAAVFAAKPAGSSAPAVRWRDLGAGGEWAEELVAPLAPEVGAGIALEYFRHTVLGGGALRRELPRFSSARELEANFGSGSRVLAISDALPAVGKGMKPLGVATRADERAVAATPETLHAGTYPLRLAIQLVFARDREASANNLTTFVYSAEAAKAMLAAGVVPLPESERVEQFRGGASGNRSRK